MSRAHRSTPQPGGVLRPAHWAHADHWPNLEVVGDSALVLRQLSGYPLQEPASSPAALPNPPDRGQAGVCHWTHHPRALNQIDDALANLDMDTHQLQVYRPTARSGHAHLHAHLSNDLQPRLADPVDRLTGLSVL